MKSNHKVLAVLLAVLLCGVFTFTAFAAGSGAASIGFSVGGVEYAPYGISGVATNLGFSFGNHSIDVSTPEKIYPAYNSVGYVVNNQSGGTKGYTVTLGLSAFDNGLEGATLILTPDAAGLQTNGPVSAAPPILLDGMARVELEADGLSSVTILEGTKYENDPDHTALGYWGVNLEGELKVFTNTIQDGESRAIMTWDLIVA